MSRLELLPLAWTSANFHRSYRELSILLLISLPEAPRILVLPSPPVLPRIIQMSRNPFTNEMANKIGKCPECKILHTYVAKIKKLFVSSSLFSCPKFLKLDNVKRAEMAQKHKACTICPSWTHQRDVFKRKAETCGENGCTLHHNKALHGTRVAYVNHVSAVNHAFCPQTNNAVTLLHVVEVQVAGT